MAGADRMQVEEVVRKVLVDEHADVLRESVKWLARQLMEVEVSELIGAEHGERTEDRATHRNGYRPRRWDTRAGEIELQIPKIRQGSYFPSFLAPRKRSEQALLSVVQQAYVCGVSTRRVDQLVESLGLRVSRSEVGARNLGFAVVERLLSDDWTVAGAARSPETLAKVRRAGAEALEVDITDQASVLAALQDLGARHGRVDLAVNAASPYGGTRSGPFGGGPLGTSGADELRRLGDVAGARSVRFSQRVRQLHERAGWAIHDRPGDRWFRSPWNSRTWAVGGRRVRGTRPHLGRRLRASRAGDPRRAADRRRGHRPIRRRRHGHDRHRQPCQRGRVPRRAEPSRDDARASGHARGRHLDSVAHRRNDPAPARHRRTPQKPELPTALHICSAPVER